MVGTGTKDLSSVLPLSGSKETCSGLLPVPWSYSCADRLANRECGLLQIGEVKQNSNERQGESLACSSQCHFSLGAPES